MSAEKTERLINLTLGLLSTKRYLTKNEIFRSIAGYEGSPETMERMFERDKDELRSMGIEIEVGQIDPLFEDEIGYLIRSSSIQIQPNDFSKEELLLMTMAANLWQRSAFSDISKNALLKVSSVDGDIGLNNLALSIIDDQVDNHAFQEIISAISNRRHIAFKYRNKDRIVAPLAIKAKDGFWYLIGKDADDVIKTFKLIRFQSKISAKPELGNFTYPESFDLAQFIDNQLVVEDRVARVKIRENRVNALRNRGEMIESHDGWDILQIVFDDVDIFTKEILWFAEDAIVISPEDLRAEVIDRLRAVSNG